MNINRFDVDIKAPSDGNGEFEAVLSAPTVDRDGEVIDPKAFEPLPEYIPIDIDHGMSVTSTVGSGVPHYDGDVLKIRGSFATTQLGQEVRTLVVERHIRKMSVAFMSAQRAEDESGTPHIVKAELLNAAIVAIPSNREADILAAKALDLHSDKSAVIESDLRPDDAEPPVITNPEETAAPAAVDPPAEVDVAMALTELALVEADLALE